ncbi:nitroreductase family deazaflavin-dependent oxidoreductase [Rugosimonospora africana]|uniref:Deazaflavin-dependent oxidoreductase, nitroreductase family n=1 Tax=Rugosimonospora africana TaxID=556532 RepID=A0A8J3VS62_9ACTN|nr:nitroreductase family deazaflavin-dependent oxidoreductase [Rugosimonospora africana]GIH16917.1 hypothetical protein Raf01_50890 [Rugosimonospora africana]
MAVTDRRPTGPLRIALRAPILLYRTGLGILAGHRLLYIAHQGRRTGLRRETVAEVVGYDPGRREVVVVAAWGRNPDWYQNLRAAPALEVRLGAHRWVRPEQRFPGGAETSRILLAYRDRHPRAWKHIAPILGFPTEPTDPRWPAVAESVHAVAFRPRDDAGADPAD